MLARCRFSASASVIRPSPRFLAPHCPGATGYARKTSPITHTGQGVFRGLNNPLTVTRYHSLLIDPPSLPDCFEVTAWSETQEIMGIRHRQWDLEGVQFHPESILSEQGHALLNNFLHRADF
jgi:para-aminobenzoate synthetase component 2